MWPQLNDKLSTLAYQYDKLWPVRRRNVLWSYILRGGLVSITRKMLSNPVFCLQGTWLAWGPRAGPSLFSLHRGFCWTEWNWILLFPTPELPFLEVSSNHFHFQGFRNCLLLSFQGIQMFERSLFPKVLCSDYTLVLGKCLLLDLNRGVWMEMKVICVC